MGEVYRARDTRLERIVAVKVLPSHLSSSPESRQRFEREAKTISQLSHPHICALHDVGREGESEYLVMEYLEGETLAARLASGPLPLDQTLRYGTEIAGALDKAHRQGIVHRDLKPANVMLTKSGVKLLDFGLAKAMAPEAKGSLTSLPTQQGLTQEGTILGTFQYMAPEQLEGKEADARTDIFALGATLYEMATGKKAFSGASQASLISQIMSADPPSISSLQPMSPAALDRVVRKSLAKDPESRWQSAADLGSELKWIAEGSQAGIPAPTTQSARRRAYRAFLAVALVTIGFIAAWLLRRPTPSTLLRTSIDLPPRMDFDTQNTSLALSPDGSSLAIVASAEDRKRRLWVRRMDAFAVQPLAGTEDASCPFWSPDGKFIGFFAEEKLKKVPATGGTVQTICDAEDGRGASWSEQDVIVFAPAPVGGLSKVSAAGGAPSPLTKQDRPGGTHRLPWFLPGGRHLLYVSGPLSSDNKETSILSLDLQTGKSALVAKEASEGRYAAPGYLLFVRDGNLMAQPFDASTVKTAGEAIPIAEKIRFSPARWAGNFSASQTGRLVFQTGEWWRKTQLTWFDLEGKELGKVGDPSTVTQLSISPDGTRAAASVRGGQGGTISEVWLYELGRGVSTRFVFGGQGSFYALWSPDGKQVVYGNLAGGISVKSADGTSEPKVLWSGAPNAWPLSWSPDGKHLVFRMQDPKTGSADLWVLDFDGEPKARPLIATPAQESSAAISPDGKWLAYTSNESGRREVYLVPFPGLGEKRQVSASGGQFPGWLGTNRVYFLKPPDNKIFVVELEARGDSLIIGPAQTLFGGKPLPNAGTTSVPAVNMAPDGKRMLIPVAIEEESSPLVRFVSDWVAELKKK
jgi:serine/threonine protein kinase